MSLTEEPMLIQEADHGTPASGEDRTVSLTIDGKPIEVAAGTSISHGASASPGMHRTESATNRGYSATQLNACGAIKPTAIPPIMPPAETIM